MLKSTSRWLLVPGLLGLGLADARADLMITPPSDISVTESGQTITEGFLFQNTDISRVAVSVGTPMVVPESGDTTNDKVAVTFGTGTNSCGTAFFLDASASCYVYVQLTISSGVGDTDVDSAKWDVSFNGVSSGSSISSGFFVTVNDASAVPGPIAGSGLPGLIAACGGALAWWRRKRTAQAVWISRNRAFSLLPLA